MAVLLKSALFDIESVCTPPPPSSSLSAPCNLHKWVNGNREQWLKPKNCVRKWRKSNQTKIVPKVSINMYFKRNKKEYYPSKFSNYVLIYSMTDLGKVLRWFYTISSGKGDAKMKILWFILTMLHYLLLKIKYKLTYWFQIKKKYYLLLYKSRHYPIE